MKKISIVISVLAVSLFACTKDKNEVADLQQSELILNYLVDSYGFNSIDIQETETGFIVENDTEFPKENFWENYAKDAPSQLLFPAGPGVEERRHRKHSYLVTSGNPVVVNVRPGVPPSWVYAILTAISEWNALDGGLKFVSTSTDRNLWNAVNIVMDPTVPANKIALTMYPLSDGRPGNVMRINPAYNSMSSSRKKFSMVHELGHAIGFRHTDTYEGLPLFTSGSCANYALGCERLVRVYLL